MKKFIATVLLLLSASNIFGQTEQEAHDAWKELIDKGGQEFNEGNLDGAMEYFQKAFLEINSFGPTPALARTFSAQAHVEQARGNLPQASRLFTNAVAMYQRSGAPVRQEVIEDIISLSTVELDLKKNDEAETYISLAFNLATRLNPGPNDLTLEVIKLLKQIKLANGKIEEAEKIGSLISEYEAK